MENTDGAWERQFGRDSSVVVLYQPLRKVYAARVPELGLTAYGDTIEEAVERLQRMFTAWSKYWATVPYKPQDR